jgi:hypothetical protein
MPAIDPRADAAVEELAGRYRDGIVADSPLRTNGPEGPYGARLLTEPSGVMTA